MIQAPQVQYIPTQVPVQQNYQQPMANVNTNTYQMPNTIYNYPVSSCYAQPAAAKSQFNGVNIEIINPQGQGVPQGMPQYMPQGALTMPANFVPVNQVQYPQMPVAQPVYPAPQAPVAPAPVVETPVVPQPQIVTTEPVQPQTPEAVAPVVTPAIQEPATQIDATQTPEAFAGKLAVDDANAQKLALEELAETIKNNDQVAPVLLDTQVFDALVNIINKDTSALEGPTPDVLELRNKPQDQLTADEVAKASTLSPLEMAEDNKKYALYTIAYMQERLNNELINRGQTALELKDLPCIENVIDVVKSNPNAGVRISGLASLSHIAKPEYKQDLTTIFEIAKSDEDVAVQQEATAALENLNK